MTPTPKFGSKDLLNCVIGLGFTLHRKQTGTSHIKYDCPKGIKTEAGFRPFIMIQMGHKVYDKNACSRYLGELKKFGFTEEKILSCLK